MNFLKRVTVLFYVTLVIFLGVSILLFTSRIWRLDDILFMSGFIYTDDILRSVFSAIALMILIVNYVFYRVFTVNVHRDKIIAFDNPAGRVSVSLMAMEDLVKRTLYKISEIKEVKPAISASKKGLHVRIRLTLRSDMNIPELTSQVQDTVKRKIADTIGLDEPVLVSIYVGKIIPESTVDKREPELPETTEKKESPIPFQGYRA